MTRNEIDDFIAQKLLGWRPGTVSYRAAYLSGGKGTGDALDFDQFFYADEWSPTENIKDAFYVVEFLKDRYSNVSLEYSKSSQRWKARFSAHNFVEKIEGPSYFGIAPTLPMAICQAALSNALSILDAEKKK